MRIGIDARELTGHATGVGRYLSGLLHEWRQPANRRGHEFILYTHRAMNTPAASAPFPLRLLTGSGGTLWEQRTLAAAIRRDGLGAFFSPGYTAPLLGGVPTVVAIHDVSFAAHPEWFSAREGLRRRFLTRRSAVAARRVITISEFSKDEIVKHLHVDPLKVRVIPPGIDTPRRATGLPAGASVGNGPRILYVGSIFNRRHIPDLIAATAAIVRTHATTSLDIVGDNRTHPAIDIAALIERQPCRAQLRWHRYVNDAELGTLYSSARAFAFLSEYEGLGLTPLEAMSMGVPALLLDTPIARESCGEAALYARTADAGGIADQLATLLFDDSIRARLRAAAPAVLTRYDWPTAARLTLEAIEETR